jgi:hypothetical protein
LIAFGDAKFTQSMRGCKSGFFTWPVTLKAMSSV